MNTIEMTDVDGDALSLIIRDGSAWITCTSGADEVTVGPFPLHMLGAALLPEAHRYERFTPAAVGSSAPSHEVRGRSRELCLLAPANGHIDSAPAQLTARARQQG